MGRNRGIASAIQQAGSQELLGAALGYEQSRISRFLHEKVTIPIRVALALEKKYGIPRHCTRADLKKGEDAF